jgi:hypothetical protein
MVVEGSRLVALEGPIRTTALAPWAMGLVEREPPPTVKVEKVPVVLELTHS